ncbi:MAG TPA: hypothetical protein DEP45_02915 [Armatimonadetes bacterium]|nr:hypothetical protein [Armatimonadota bacterium]
MGGGLAVGPCRPKELPQLRKLLNEVFITERNTEGDLFNFAPLLYNDANVENLRVVRDGRTIVGHAGICVRPIRWRGQVFQAGLIGGVCARKDLRGTGIGTLAMEDVAQRMTELGLDFGVLWTGSQGFYQRLGWRTAGGLCMMRILEAAEGGASGFEVMPLNESPFRPEDCHRLHEAAGRNEVIRTAQETRVQMGIPTRSAWIGLSGGHLAGYAVRAGETLQEIEGDAGVCAALIVRAASEGVRRCVFPLNDPRVAAIEGALPVCVERRSMGMLLIVNRASLTAKIAPETCATAADLGIGPLSSAEVLMARIFGQPEREPSEEPLPLDIHISYLDHV